MKLEKAFSIELKYAVSPVDADLKYSQGKITSKFKFECPDNNCHAAVTCANLDRPKDKRILEPYYKVVEEHSANCLIAKGISAVSRKQTQYVDIYSEEDEYISNAVRLNLRPPSTKRPDGVIDASKGEIVTKNRLRREVDEGFDGKKKKQSSKVLSSMVDSFLNNEKLIVQLPGIGTMPIKELFVEVKGQAIDSFVDEFRIYFGKAWFNKHETGYAVTFTNKLNNGDIATRPSFFIPNHLISKTSYRLFQESKLDEQTDKKPKLIFIASETGPYCKGEYINFWLEGLEYLEYRVQ